MSREFERGFDVPGFEKLRELIERYDRRVPRYTSYPAAPHWSDAFGEPEFLEALGGVDSDELSVYVHVPFCERLCSFCACNRVITRDHSVAEPYLDALEREAGLLADALRVEPKAVQLSIGGGSPSFLSEKELTRLAAIVDGYFPPSPGAERSIEMDPRTTSRAQLEVLAAAGFNRISVGVQDLSPRVQKAINRIQPREMTEETLRWARALGFESANLDLIYGLPYQTVDSFDHTLDDVIELRPERIALYSYAHVTWVAKQQRGFEKKDLPAPDEKLAIFLRATERLTKAGYLFLGLDHFALPEDDLASAAAEGTLHRNFMGYGCSGGENLLALGPSGISELAGAYAQSERDPEAWGTTLRTGHLATKRGWKLSDDDRRRKWLIQRLMCRGDVDGDAYHEAFGEPLDERVPDWRERLRPFTADGLLEGAGDRYHVTSLGRLFLRAIATTFDAYLAAEPAQPMYSRTV